ncbi:MAG: glycoside hydrolase family 127 protein [Lachnospiraceae bacterium]|nr:glycoside hydrolase family 127 protein [Lachnospiraceae bacterium]
MLERIPPERVRLLPGIFRARMEVNTEYLLSLDTRALLQNYALEAGEKPGGEAVLSDPQDSWFHWGWEAPSCQLRGHFLGHWMSAAAFLVRSEKSRVLKARLFDIIDKLREYQLKNGGRWVGPIPEKYFEFMLAGQDIWSPQYTMNKLFMGLLDAYECTGYEPAMTILSHLSDWYLDWFEKSDAIDRNVSYKGESCGMLEVWARLYRLTGEEKYRALLKRYEFPELFAELKAGRDPLTGVHANASIPWAIGAARIYEIKRKEEWLETVKAFWECAVSKRGMYASSGANAGEFWIPPGAFAEYAGDRDQEFCTVYNMVRLADALFRFTGEEQYADYIERCLYNGFLAQQDPRTGMPTYFLPQRNGGKKKWGSRTRDFWCCHGTMVQAHTIVNSLIYYKDEDKLTVAQYIPSRAEFKICGTPVVVEQICDMKYSGSGAKFAEFDTEEHSRYCFRLRIRTGRPQRFLLKLRIPGWVKGMPLVSVGKERRFITEDVIRDGYLKLDREWEDSEINISFPVELRTESLPDDPSRKAVFEGPVLLAALSDDVYLSEEPRRALKRHSEHSYEEWPWLQSHYRAYRDGGCVDFMPLYEVTDEAYTIYVTSG